MTHHQRHGGETTQTNLYPTAVALPEETRIHSIQMLNRALAATTDLQSQAKFAHWNVKGYDFYQLHLLFDELAETLSEHVDLLAERITALGGQAMGTTRMAAAASHVPEPPANAVTEAEYLDWLTDHVAQHANALRRRIDDAGDVGDEDTADLFTELSRDVDEQLYFLESHLQTDVKKQVPATGGQAGTRESSRQTGAGAGSRGQTGTHQGERQAGTHESERQTGTGASSGSGGQTPAGRPDAGAAGGQGATGEASPTGQQPAGVDGGTHFRQSQQPAREERRR